MSENLTIRSDTAELDRARDLVANFIGQDLDPQEKNRVILAVDEALANIIEHAYGGNTDRQIEMQMERTAGKFVFTIDDDGDPFDPTVERPLDLGRHAAAGHSRGLGIYLFTTLMEARHEPGPHGGNRLILSKAIAD